MVDKDEALKDLDKYKSLDALKNSDGGKLLISALSENVRVTVESLMNSKHAHEEFIRLSVVLKESVNILRSLNRSTKQKELVAEIVKNLAE